MTLHTIRDWRGIKIQVSRCTTDELMHMLTEAVGATNQIAQFIAEVQAELVARDAIPSDPASVA